MTLSLLLGVALAQPPEEAPSAPSARCVAHRGNNEAELENSWAALRSAHEVGAAGIELDVRHTADGHAVLLHDRSLRRVAADHPGCPARTPVAKLALADLATCTLRNGEAVPRLAEVLTRTAAADWPATLFVELKDVPSDRTVALLARAQAARGDRLRVISFDRGALAALDGVDDLIRYKLAPKLWLPRPARRLGEDWAGYDLHFASRRRVRRLHDLGGDVAVWTVDRARRIQRWAEKGVDWITTNRPEACAVTLQRNSLGFARIPACRAKPEGPASARIPACRAKPEGPVARSASKLAPLTDPKAVQASAKAPR